MNIMSIARSNEPWKLEQWWDGTWPKLLNIIGQPGIHTFNRLKPCKCWFCFIWALQQRGKCWCSQCHSKAACMKGGLILAEFHLPATGWKKLQAAQLMDVVTAFCAANQIGSLVSILDLLDCVYSRLMLWVSLSSWWANPRHMLYQ